MVECTSFGLKIMESPQEKICGNTIYLPEDADEDEVRKGYHARKFPRSKRLADSWWRTFRLRAIVLYRVVVALSTVGVFPEVHESKTGNSFTVPHQSKSMNQSSVPKGVQTISASLLHDQVGCFSELCFSFCLS